MTLDEFTQLEMLPLCEVVRDSEKNIFTELNPKTGLIRVNVVHFDADGGVKNKDVKYQLGPKFYDTLEAAYADYSYNLAEDK